MTEEKKIRLRDCPTVREQVLRAWFSLKDSYELNEYERDWVNAGPLTLIQHSEHLENVLHFLPEPFTFLSFLDGWAACLLSQKNEEEKK